MDCFQLRPVPFAFCSSCLTTSTSETAFGAAGAAAGACLPAPVPLDGIEVEGRAIVVVAGRGVDLRVEEGVVGLDPAG